MFLYSGSSNEVENSNALARFIIVLAVITAFVSRRYVVAALILCLLPLAVPVENQDVPESQSARMLKYCQSPSVTNPMANPNPADYGRGMKLPACPTSAPEVQSRVSDELSSQEITGHVIAAAGMTDAMKLSDRQFYSMPSTTVPGNRENYMRALYGESIDRRIP
jgi:hypothetical protein